MSGQPGDVERTGTVAVSSLDVWLILVFCVLPSSEPACVDL